MGVPSDNSADSFDVMEILDSEDEELQRAIDASLQAAMANNQERYILTLHYYFGEVYFFL